MCGPHYLSHHIYALSPLLPHAPSNVFIFYCYLFYLFLLWKEYRLQSFEHLEVSRKELEECSICCLFQNISEIHFSITLYGLFSMHLPSSSCGFPRWHVYHHKSLALGGAGMLWCFSVRVCCWMYKVHNSQCWGSYPRQQWGPEVPVHLVGHLRDPDFFAHTDESLKAVLLPALQTAVLPLIVTTHQTAQNIFPCFRKFQLMFLTN